MGTPLTGKGWSGTKETSNRANSVKVPFSDGTAGSGVDGSSVTPGAFTVSGNTVTAAQLGDGAVYLTLADNLASTEKPTVTVAAGTIMDKAGNGVLATSTQAADGLGPNLSLAEDADLSKMGVEITITTDEQLRSNPETTLSGVADGDGALIASDATACVTADGLTIVGDAAYRADLNASGSPGCAELDDEGEPVIPDPTNAPNTEAVHSTAVAGLHPEAPRDTGTMTQSAALLVQVRGGH